MALILPPAISARRDMSVFSLNSDFLPSTPLRSSGACRTSFNNGRTLQRFSRFVTSSIKRVRDSSLDKHVVKQNKIRFVQKLRTLLLSKPKHYMPIQILSKCRSYLSLSSPQSVLSMIHRYPTIFELFMMPTAPTPFNATKPLSQLCVRLTTDAAALAREEYKIKSAISTSLAVKLQKLLMLSSHHRLLLSKLVHIAPDLGLPANFRTHLCNDHPDKFKIVDTSYGRALALISCDLDIANPLPSPDFKPTGLIVDRPLKFKHLRLRKGINLKRRHHAFLLKFREVTDVCPYKTPASEFAKASVKAEKRACYVVREMLGLMVEKRTLVDHLTHFRKEFGLPNKLRALLLRHPDLFYVSMKGQRDSVFLVEGYDKEGKLLEIDETLLIRDRLFDLVREGKRVRREHRLAFKNDVSYGIEQVDEHHDNLDEGFDFHDSLDDLFQSDDDADDDDDAESSMFVTMGEEGELWSSEVTSLNNENKQHLEPW